MSQLPTVPPTAFHGRPNLKPPRRHRSSIAPPPRHTHPKSGNPHSAPSTPRPPQRSAFAHFARFFNRLDLGDLPFRSGDHGVGVPFGQLHEPGVACDGLHVCVSPAVRGSRLQDRKAQAAQARDGPRDRRDVHALAWEQLVATWRPTGGSSGCACRSPSRWRACASARCAWDFDQAEKVLVGGETEEVR